MQFLFFRAFPDVSFSWLTVQISVVELDSNSDSFNGYLNEISILRTVNDTYVYTATTAYMSLSHV